MKQKLSATEIETKYPTLLSPRQRMAVAGREVQNRHILTLLTLGNTPCAIRRWAENLLMPGSSNDTKQKSAATEKGNGHSFVPKTSH